MSLPVLAFVGLGQMGQPMTARLLQAGYTVRGHDVTEAARAAFAAKGGNACATAAEAAAGAEVLITMLPTSAVVRDALLGAGNAAAALAPGALVIDMSSSNPVDTQKLARDLAALGVALLDAWTRQPAQDWLAASLPLLRSWKQSQIAGLQERGWQVLPSDTPYFCARPPQPQDAVALCAALRVRGLALRDASSFALPGWLRLGVRTPQAQQALWQALDDLAASPAIAAQSPSKAPCLPTPQPESTE